MGGFQGRFGAACAAFGVACDLGEVGAGEADELVEGGVVDKCVCADVIFAKTTCAKMAGEDIAHVGFFWVVDDDFDVEAACTRDG